MSLTAHRRGRGDDGEGVNASARAAQLTRAQTAILTVNKVRFGLGKMQQTMANLAISTAALKDNLACVREELDESMESSAFAKLIIKTYGILTFAGSIVWRMLMAMPASRTTCTRWRAASSMRATRTRCCCGRASSPTRRSSARSVRTAPGCQARGSTSTT